MTPGAFTATIGLMFDSKRVTIECERILAYIAVTTTLCFVTLAALGTIFLGALELHLN
jgi:hypothetical protein